jgi:uncharacterized protein (DUF433 family)
MRRGLHPILEAPKIGKRNLAFSNGFRQCSHTGLGRSANRIFGSGVRGSKGVIVPDCSGSRNSFPAACTDGILCPEEFSLWKRAATGRVTIEPGKRGRKPCIRGLRITGQDVLGWPGAGMSESQILDEHSDPEKADFRDIYRFAAAGSRANLH